MLRTVWFAIAAIVITVPAALATIAVALRRSNSPLVELIMRAWARALVYAAGIDLRTENAGVIDRSRRYILVANHYSYLDIPCIVAAIPQPIRFMAKVSLFKIPIFGWALARSGFIPIDRNNRRTAVKSFDLAAARIRQGDSVVVFPEEGRSRERSMRPFQRGAFLLALKSEQMIVPLAIDGTFDVFPATRWRVKAGPVTIKVGTPIPTAGLTVRDKDRLARESREQIETMLFGGANNPPATSELA